jgi:hypothetical protein
MRAQLKSRAEVLRSRGPLGKIDALYRNTAVGFFSMPTAQDSVTLLLNLKVIRTFPRKLMFLEIVASSFESGTVGADRQM